MFYVHKLGKPIIISGIGVHSGEKTTIELSPIDEDKIIFYNKYTDCFIELKHEYVKNFNSTSLISGKCRFHTIEHLMAVIYILQIKGIIIETDSEEIPILDGSGKMFWEKIKKAVISTGKSSDFIKIDKNITMRIIANIKLKPLKLPLTNIRYIPSKFHSSVSTYIFNNKVALIMWVEKPIGIIIEHKEVYDSYKNYFEYLWSESIE